MLPSHSGDSGGCLWRSQPQACGESVMARLSASPSPVIRRVNTAPRSAWGRSRRERRRGHTAPVLLSLELSGSNFELGEAISPSYSNVEETVDLLSISNEPSLINKDIDHSRK